MNNKQLRWGVILSYLSQAISLLSGLIYTPIMLRILGQSEYGLYQLATSTISYLGILNFGFSSGYLRIYFRFKVADEDKKIANLNGMYIIIFTVISFATLICGLVVTLNVRLLFATGLTDSEFSKIQILMVIMILNLIITFISSVFDCYISAFNEFIFQRGLQVLKSLVNPFISLPLLLTGYGSVGIALVSFGLTFLSFGITTFYCLKKLNMCFRFREIDKKVFKELTNFTMYIFLSSVVDKINLSLDNFLLGRMVGTISVAIYGVGSQINGFYNMISSSIATVYAPTINTIVASSNDNDKLTDFFIKVSKPLFLILGIIWLGFVFFGKWFIGLWAGEGYLESYYVAIILMTGCYLPLLQVCGIEIQKAKNMHRARSIAYFVIALGNIGISIPLIRAYGPIGASLGTTISMLLGSGLFMNYYYSHRIGLHMKKYWFKVLSQCKYFLFPIIVGVVFAIINRSDLIFTLFFGLLFVSSFLAHLYLDKYDIVKK